MAKRPAAVEGQSPAIHRRELKLREEIASAMEVAAKEAGIKIKLPTLVYASGEKLVVANVLAEGAGDFTVSRLRGGAVLMFAYFGVPAGATLKPSRQSLRSGFYAVKVSGKDRKVTAELIGPTGERAAECPATITTAKAPVGAPAPEGKTSVSVKGGGRGNLFGCVTIDASGSKLGVVFTITVKVCL